MFGMYTKKTKGAYVANVNVCHIDPLDFLRTELFQKIAILLIERISLVCSDLEDSLPQSSVYSHSQSEDY